MRSKFTLLLLALNLALFGYLALTERWITPDKVEENRRRILGPEAADHATSRRSYLLTLEFRRAENQTHHPEYLRIAGRV